MKSNKVWPFLFFTMLTLVSFSQKPDSTKATSRFAGVITVTSKGISTIPNLTLGKPAALFDLSIGKGTLSFEPQFRFSLEGKPWVFLFWWRYKLLKIDRFQFNIGAHPALSFKTVTSLTDTVLDKTVVVKRYLAGELAPNYSISKNISIGMYYLYSRGIDKYIPKNTNMIALRSNFSNIKISDQLFMGFAPQIYYLIMDKNDGFYLNSSLTLAKRNFPFSVSAMMNKRIKSNIPADNNFIWNVSLKYSFGKEYVEK